MSTTDKKSNSNSSNSSNKTNSNSNSGTDSTNPHKNEGWKFIGRTLLTIILVLMFFAFGSVFIDKANFYTKYKMSGRFANGPPYTTNFPYKNYFTDAPEDSIPFRFMRWLTDILITSFSKNRYLLDMFFNHVGNYLKNAPDYTSSILLFLSPIICISLLVATYIAGLVSTLIGAVSNFEQVIPNLIEFGIMALPLCIPLFIYAVILFNSVTTMSVGIAITQTIMMLGFMLIIPLMDANKRQMIINTMIDNRFMILLTISGITTYNAFKTLNKTYSYISLGMTISTLASYIFMRLL